MANRLHNLIYINCVNLVEINTYYTVQLNNSPPLINIIRVEWQLFSHSMPHLGLTKLEQAEAEVVPSSSLVELEVEVRVGVGVEVGVRAWVKMQFNFLTFSVRWVVGWVGGEMEIKANLSLSLVEVEAELGN